MKRLPSSHRFLANWWTCPGCGKRSYPNRRAARRAGRHHLPNEPVNGYLCLRGGTGWHYGHLPDAVRAGSRSRSDLV